jgi:hypothetical protein
VSSKNSDPPTQPSRPVVAGFHPTVVFRMGNQRNRSPDREKDVRYLLTGPAARELCCLMPPTSAAAALDHLQEVGIVETLNNELPGATLFQTLEAVIDERVRAGDQRRELDHG